MTFDAQTFHHSTKGDCFSVRQCSDDGLIDLCLLTDDGHWCAVATFHHAVSARWFVEYMQSFLNTTEAKVQ